MKKILILSFLPFLLFAQKQSTVSATDPVDLRLAVCSFATIYIGDVSNSVIANYLKRNNSKIQPKDYQQNYGPFYYHQVFAVPLAF